MYGPHHIAFHMLQLIFIINKDVIKWAQETINWKKVNTNKVSESFGICRRLCMVALEELERLAVDYFLINRSKEISTLLQNPMDHTLGLKIVSVYNE